MVASGFRNLAPREHARELFDPFLAFEHGDGRDRSTSPCLFLDPVVSVRKGCDLRKVGDAQNLMVTCGPLQSTSDRLGDRPTHPGIDFVEDIRGDVISRREHALDREQNAGELPSGSDATQRRKRFASVRGKQELHVIAAARTQVRERFDLHLQTCGLEVKCTELLLDGRGQALRRFGASSMELAGGEPSLVFRQTDLLLQTGQTSIDMVEAIELPPHLFGSLDQPIDVDLVFAAEALEFVQAILCAFELARIVFELRSKTGRSSGRFFAGDLGDGQLLADRCEMFGVLGTPARAFTKRRQPRRDRIVAFVEDLLGITRKLDPAMRLSHQTQPTLERIVLAGVRADAVDLLDLESQIVGTARAFGRLPTKLFELFAQLAYVAMQCSIHRSGLTEPGVGIEHVDVPRRVGQEVVLMLRTNVDELLTELTEYGLGREGTLHEAPPATGPRNVPLHDECFEFTRRKSVFFEQSFEPDGEIRRRLELSVHDRRIRPLANGLGPRLRASQERERTDDHRFAGPGFSGQDVHSSRELHRNVVEQSQTANTQIREHGKVLGLAQDPKSEDGHRRTGDRYSWM